MSKVYCCLGKYGDLLSVAPIVQHEWKLTGKLQPVMVSKPYADLAGRIPGFNVIPFGSDFFDLRGAIQQAKKAFRTVIPLQVFDHDTKFRKLTPSFQLDQWARAGVHKHFLDWPLELKRDGRTEIPKQPYVLLADLAQSSPFNHKEELARLIKETLPKHKLIRLSEIRTKHLLDFLPIYDQAELIVSVDTSHLHLTRACQTPVIAIVSDNVSRWHGSAWHPRFRLHVRYKDLLKRKQELSRAILEAVNQTPPLETEAIPTEHRFGYNPSIIRWKDRVLTTYRYHDRGDWRTRIAIHDGEKTKTIKFPEQFSDYSFEDGRLFTINSRLMLAYVVARSEHGLQNAVQHYGQLVTDGEEWGVSQWWQPKYGNNDWSSMEKNWTPIVHDGRVFFVYQTNPEQIVLEMDGDKVVKVRKSKSPTWEYGDIRGGCVIPREGKLLRFFHSHTTEGPRETYIYRIGCALMNSTPPFETIKVSPEPILAGNEKWTPCKHWKQNVAFCCGAILSGDNILLSIGRNDCESAIVTLKPSDIPI